MKELNLAIISTLSLPTSSETKMALRNLKAIRKCVQASTGEMLTYDSITACLQQDKEHEACRTSKFAAKKTSATM